MPKTAAKVVEGAATGVAVRLRESSDGRTCDYGGYGEPMSKAEDIWRGRTDGDVLAAANRVEEYTEIGRKVILAELARRQLDRFSLTPDDTASDPVRAGSGGAEASVRPSGNYLGRLWRGELSLPVTYWGCGVLGRVLWAALLVTVTSSTDSLGVQQILGLLSLAYVVTVSVGIWRSSARYSGYRIWGDLARVSMALGILQTLARAFAGR